MDQPISYRRRSSSYKEPIDLSQRLCNAICEDDKDEFLRLVKDPEFEQLRNEYKADRIFKSDAVDIAIAVFNGETNGSINLEDVLVDGLTPLHLAAAMGAPRLTKYLLERGDNVDAMCDYESMNLKQVTPIDLAVEAIERGIVKGFDDERRPWTQRKSIFELLVYVCEMQRPSLEALRLLIRNTQNTERIRNSFIDYADKGHLVQFVVLFLAAPEVFLSPNFATVPGGLSTFDMLYLVLNSLEKKTDIEEGLSLLLDVFAIVGDKLVAYIRLEDPGVWELGTNQKELKIAFFLREVARKKLGISSPIEYFFGFFKPLRPGVDQLLASPPKYLPEWWVNAEFDGYMILSFHMKRKDINISYINRRIPPLKPEDAALLNRAIENKLSPTSTLHALFETTTKLSKKGVKPVTEYIPFLYGRNFESSIRSFPRSTASAKPWFNFKFTPSNNLVTKVMPLKNLKYFFPFVKLSHLPMIVKQLIK